MTVQARRLNVALGLDGGGSKTTCVVLDAEGHPMGHGLSGPSNPVRVGLESACRELAQAAAQALSQARLAPRQVDAVCAGLAGAGRRSVMRGAIAFITHEFPNALTHVATDGEIALEAAVGAGSGVALVAGTGSLVFGRNHQGETARVGGYGRWIGDEGSAYDIGRCAVACVARARDQATPQTLLAEMIPTALESTSWDDLNERISKNPDDVFPRIFPVVAAAADREDDAAREILLTAASQLCGMALAVARRLGMLDAEFPLFKCGGVFGHGAILDDKLDSLLAAAIPGARVSRLDADPAMGAARLAARLAAQEQPMAASG